MLDGLLGDFENFWGSLTWRCDVCGNERPNEKISVHPVDITDPSVPTVKVVRNVKFCNDVPACKESAENWKGYGGKG